MKLKSFIAFATALGFSLLAARALAVFNDATFGATTNFSVAGITLNIIGGDAASVTVSTNSFDIALESGGFSHFEIRSSDKKNLTVTQTVGTKSVNPQFTCGSSYSSLVIDHGSNDEATTVTVTPQTTTCSDAGGGGGGGGGSSGSSGGGGGGGGGYSAPSVVPPSSTTQTPAAATQSSSPAVSAVFSGDLQFGMTSGDVRRLQELLSQDTSVYPEKKVTGYFGPATRAAVRKFQAKHGLPTVGRVGPATRAKIAEVFGGVSETTATPAPSGVSSSSDVAAKIQLITQQIQALQAQLQLLLKQ